jgi:hypothetical protein
LPELAGLTFTVSNGPAQAPSADLGIISAKAIINADNTYNPEYTNLFLLIWKISPA